MRPHFGAAREAAVVRERIRAELLQGRGVDARVGAERERDDLLRAGAAVDVCRANADEVVLAAVGCEIETAGDLGAERRRRGVPEERLAEEENGRARAVDE